MPPSHDLFKDVRARLLPPPWCCRCCMSGSCFLPLASPSAQWLAASPGQPLGSGWWPSRLGHPHWESGGHLEGVGGTESPQPSAHLHGKLCPGERIHPLPSPGSTPRARGRKSWGPGARGSNHPSLPRETPWGWNRRSMNEHSQVSSCV